MKVRNAETSQEGTGTEMDVCAIKTAKQGEFIIWETEDGSLEVRSNSNNLIIKPMMTNRVVVSQ